VCELLGPGGVIGTQADKLSLMTAKEQKIYEEALQLSKGARADLAARLLESLEDAPEENVEEAWAEEIEVRARRALAGESKGTDAELIETRLKDRLRQR
jgi:hypothetical protein